MSIVIKGPCLYVCHALCEIMQHICQCMSHHTYHVTSSSVNIVLITIHYTSVILVTSSNTDVTCSKSPAVTSRKTDWIKLANNFESDSEIVIEQESTFSQG